MRIGFAGFVKDVKAYEARDGRPAVRVARVVGLDDVSLLDEGSVLAELPPVGTYVGVVVDGTIAYMSKQGSLVVRVSRAAFNVQNLEKGGE